MAFKRQSIQSVIRIFCFSLVLLLAAAGLSAESTWTRHESDTEAFTVLAPDTWQYEEAMTAKLSPSDGSGSITIETLAGATFTDEELQGTLASRVAELSSFVAVGESRDISSKQQRAFLQPVSLPDSNQEGIVAVYHRNDLLVFATMVGNLGEYEAQRAEFERILDSIELSAGLPSS